MLTPKLPKAKISLIILNWNGKTDTLECLYSIQKITYPPFEVIVVDNGSSDDSVSAIKKEFPDITLLETKENLGFAGGNNVGIRYALKQGADAVCLLNNDVIVDPDFLTALVISSSKNPGVGILGAKIYLYDQKDKLDHIGGFWNAEKASFDLIGNRALEKDFSWDDRQNLDYVCGAAFFVKKQVFEKIGLLEEKFFLYWEESDFCSRAKKAGFFVRCCSEAKVWHKIGSSITGGKPNTTYFWWRNRMLWIERNCSPQEKKKLYKKVLTPEIMHLLKLKMLGSFQLLLLRCLFLKKKIAQKKEKLFSYRAALQGIKDYSQGRFGQAPAWIYQKRK